jgi:hypothetical protein
MGSRELTDTSLAFVCQVTSWNWETGRLWGSYRPSRPPEWVPKTDQNAEPTRAPQWLSRFSFSIARILQRQKNHGPCRKINWEQIRPKLALYKTIIQFRNIKKA